MVVDPVNWCVIGRLGRENLWRLTYGEDAELDEASILERLPERFAAILPDPQVPYRIDNFSPYRVHQRCAPSFRVGRVLLAGDAAHAVQPVRRARADRRGDRCRYLVRHARRGGRRARG